MVSSRGSSAGTRTNRQTSVCLKTRKRSGRKTAVAASRRLDVSGNHRHAPDRSNAPESSNAASVRDDLPSQQLSQLLKHLSISERDSTLAPLSPASNGLQEAVVANFNDVVLPHLQSLFPTTTLQKLLPSSAHCSTGCQMYSMAQIDFLSYAASNNLAGMDKTVGLGLVYEYLKDPLHGLVANISSVASRKMMLANILAMKPMAETLFQGAIEAGDDRTVQTLLSLGELGLDVNDSMCTSYRMEPCSPIERAAELCDVALVRLLLAYGANVHGINRRAWDISDAEWRTERIDFPRGALEYALGRYDYLKGIVDYCRRLELKQIELLLQAGGDFAGEFLLRPIRNGNSRLVRILITGRLATCYKSWLELGIFHEAMERLPSETNALIMLHLCEARGNLNQEHYIKKETRPRWLHLRWHSRYSPYLIDIAAERGDFRIVQLLYESGAQLTDSTLIAAIRSRNQCLIHALLEWAPPLDTFSSHFRTTAYAEAIRTKDSTTLQTLVTRGCEATLMEPKRLCAALAALAEVGDLAALQNMREKYVLREARPAWVDA